MPLFARWVDQPGRSVTPGASSSNSYIVATEPHIERLGYLRWLYAYNDMVVVCEDITTAGAVAAQLTPLIGSEAYMNICRLS